ncbi:cytidine deaminase, partial [Klebsiella oxytoca]
MKDLTITAIIKVYQYDELNEADRSLMKTAM